MRKGIRNVGINIPSETPKIITVHYIISLCILAHCCPTVLPYNNMHSIIIVTCPTTASRSYRKSLTLTTSAYWASGYEGRRDSYVDDQILHVQAYQLNEEKDTQEKEKEEIQRQKGH
jgi:hypothetical protein